MALALTSATFLVIVGCCTVFAQVPERPEGCLGREAGQMQQPEAPPKIIQFKSIHLKSSEPLAISEQQILSELQASPATKDRIDGPQDALSAIQQILQHHGYFRAVLDRGNVETITNRKQEEIVNLTAEVKPGKQYRLDQIVFANAAQFDDRQLREFFPIAQGDIFNTAKISKGIEALRKAYGERGFINFAAVPSTTEDEKRGTISLQLDVDEGSQFRVANFELVGLDQALAERLVEESGLKPGDIFNTKLLADFFEHNKSLLPPDATPEDDVTRTMDERAGTVNLKLDVRRCPVVPK